MDFFFKQLQSRVRLSFSDESASCLYGFILAVFNIRLTRMYPFYGRCFPRQFFVPCTPRRPFASSMHGHGLATPKVSVETFSKKLFQGYVLEQGLGVAKMQSTCLWCLLKNICFIFSTLIGQAFISIFFQYHYIYIIIYSILI